MVPAKIDLKHPVQVDGVHTKALSMRRPKVRDLLAADKAGKGDAEREVHLFACLCEVEPALIEELDMDDYGRLQKAYRDFLS